MAACAPHEGLRVLCLSAASQIAVECRDSGRCGLIPQPLAGCGEALIELLGRQASLVVDLFGHLVSQSSSSSAESPARSSLDAGDADADHDGETSHPKHPKRIRLLLKRLDDLISLAYSQFYAYVHSRLPPCWRQLYTDASILKFAVLFLCPATTADHGHDDQALQHMVKTLDLALILAGAGGEARGRPWIDKAFSLLEQAWHDETKSRRQQHLARRREPMQDQEGTAPWASHPSFSATPTFTPPVSRPISRVQAMSLDAFQAYMDRPPDRALGPAPLIISDLQDGWPARTSRPWSKPAYLLSRTFGGRRLVPVEVGRSYVDEGWAQQIISFGDFLREYMDPTPLATSPRRAGADKAADDEDFREGKDTGNSAAPVGYLAQHQLFAQLPQLRADIAIPDYCWTAPPPPPSPALPEVPELEEPQLNAWFGPAGTITPLHTDPYHNLLAQVVGTKYVRLYSPRETPRMRPRGREDGVDMANTSLFRVERLERWAMDEWGQTKAQAQAKAEDSDDGEQDRPEEEALRADFAAIPYCDCILEPGDTLYIPVGWWHYVLSATPSFSVSFWWN